MSDIIIIGAGLVGASLALALHQNGCNVQLLDATPFAAKRAFTGAPDLRCSALVPQSISFLRDIGAWSKMTKHRMGVFKSMQVWHESASAKNCLLKGQDNAQAELGVILENSLIQQSLDEALQEQQIEVIRPVSIKNITIQDNTVSVLCHDKHDDEINLQAALLIAADGAQSWVRSYFDFPLEKKQYDEKAIVTFVRHELPHHDTARQVFMESGTLAFLPLYDKNLSSIVWSANNTDAAILLDDTESAFNEKLSQKMLAFYGHVIESGSRASFTLQRQHAKDYIKPRVALVGDAAHSVHPLAGQGLNLGFADAIELTQVMAQAQKKRRDVGAIDTLRKFERARKTKNKRMLAAIELAHSGSQCSGEMLPYFLSEGLALSNQVQAFKRWVIGCASNP